MTIDTIEVEHVTYASERAFEAVIADFERQVGTLEDVGLPSILAAADDRAAFERRVQTVVGPSGFMRFLTIDHGYWSSKAGRPT